MKTKITKNHFKSYIAIQKAGYYNMFDPKARQVANLMVTQDEQISKDQWIYIMKFYAPLKEYYGF